MQLPVMKSNSAKTFLSAGHTANKDPGHFQKIYQNKTQKKERKRNFATAKTKEREKERRGRCWHISVTKSC